MKLGYYPGCSLTGGSREYKESVVAMAKAFDIELVPIPDWNCCGAFEYGDRRELTEFSKKNLVKAAGLFSEIVAPCPACYKNLREADEQKEFIISHPLDLFDDAFLADLKPEAVDLNLIIDNAMSYTSSQVREKNISLHLDLPKKVAAIHADREALQQILIHLLQNAGAATPVEGGAATPPSDPTAVRTAASSRHLSGLDQHLTLLPK